MALCAFTLDVIVFCTPRKANRHLHVHVYEINRDLVLLVFLSTLVACQGVRTCKLKRAFTPLFSLCVLLLEDPHTPSDEATVFFLYMCRLG